MNGQVSNTRRGWVMVAALLGVLSVAFVCRQSLARDDHDQDRDGDSRFSERSIKGYWGYNTSFAMLLPPAVPQALPTTAMGRMYFDGRGGCDVKSVVNLNGDSMALQSSACRYQVNADGTGTAEAVFPSSPIADPVPVAFVIVDGEQELRFVNTRYIVGTFTARRQ
jgi:hypothetical protein